MVSMGATSMMNSLSLNELQTNKNSFNRFFDSLVESEDSTANFYVSDNIGSVQKLKTSIVSPVNDKMEILSQSQLLKKRTEENLKKIYQTSIFEEDDNDMCPSCKTSSIITKGGYKVCTSCGTTLDGVIDDGQEWRFYGAEDTKSSDPTRCGLPTNNLLPISSLGSTVSYCYSESYKMKKIRNFHKWNAMPYNEKVLYDSFATISLRAANAGIPQCIIEEAKNIYSKIYRVSISRDTNKLAIQASCVMAACQMKKVPRNCQEIAKIFQISLSKMRKGAKKFEEIWKMIENQDHTRDKLNLHSSNPIDYLHRFCSKLDLSDEIYEVCVEVCKVSEEENVMGSHISTSRAAGIIYFVTSHCGINVTRDDIFYACGVSQVTTGKCFNKLNDYFAPQLIKLFG